MKPADPNERAAYFARALEEWNELPEEARQLALDTLLQRSRVGHPALHPKSQEACLQGFRLLCYGTGLNREGLTSLPAEDLSQGTQAPDV
jgi:hypothetical protein